MNELSSNAAPWMLTAASSSACSAARCHRPGQTNVVPEVDDAALPRPQADNLKQCWGRGRSTCASVHGDVKKNMPRRRLTPPVLV